MDRIRAFNNYFGDMDLMLLDLVLKRSIPQQGQVLDAGCGQGRNLIYFVQAGYEVFGVDRDPSAVELTRYVLANLSDLPVDRIRTGDLGQLDFPDATFDLVLCSRVLHFAEDASDFLRKWQELRRIVKKGGRLYVAMDAVFGLVHNSKRLSDGKWQLPDGSVRFALTQELIQWMEIDKDFKWLEPLRTVIHRNEHAESSFFLEKL